MKLLLSILERFFFCSDFTGSARDGVLSMAAQSGNG